MAATSPSFAGVVLAGGRGRRLARAMGLDTVDKASLQVGELSMLDSVLAALQGADRVVVVGGATAPPGTTHVVERPAGGGPVAGLAAGLDVVDTPVTVVLATDLPRVDVEVVEWLRSALSTTPPDVAAVMPTGADGRRQPLAAAYRTEPLRAALRSLGDPAGHSMRDLCAHLVITELDVGDLSGKLMDVDTTEDLAAARLHAWAAALVSTLDVPLNPKAVAEVISLVLDMARDAAHGIARPAAPVTTFLAGVAVGAALTSSDSDVDAIVRQVGDTVAVVLTRHKVG